MLSVGFKTSTESVKGLIEVLIRILREEHVIKKIQKAYQSIPLAQAKTLLGMKAASESEFSNLVESKGMRINGGYVYPPSEDRDVKRFEINEERI